MPQEIGVIGSVIELFLLEGPRSPIRALQLFFVLAGDRCETRAVPLPQFGK